MSLNGLMGVGLASGRMQNPWDANSPAAVDFRPGLRVEDGNGVLWEPNMAMPQDHVTLTSLPTGAGSS